LGGAAAGSAQQQALLQQVLSMSQMQIDMLPPDQRQTVMAIVSRVLTVQDVGNHTNQSLRLSMSRDRVRGGCKI
jgi:hypothetical protein